MKQRDFLSTAISYLSVAITSLAIGCGGSKTPPQVSTSAPNSAPLPLSVTVSPDSLFIKRGNNWKFSASVVNTNASVDNTNAVSWSVQEGAVGGAVSDTGTYSAPMAAGVYHVVATSKVDSSKSA